jgi:hypothetical protein
MQDQLMHCPGQNSSADLIGGRLHRTVMNHSPAKSSTGQRILATRSHRLSLTVSLKTSIFGVRGAILATAFALCGKTSPFHVDASLTFSRLFCSLVPKSAHSPSFSSSLLRASDPSVKTSRRAPLSGKPPSRPADWDERPLAVDDRSPSTLRCADGGATADGVAVVITPEESAARVWKAWYDV